MSLSLGDLINIWYNMSLSLGIKSVKTTCGETSDFLITIGLHQGSALSPYLFALMMDKFNCSYSRGGTLVYVVYRGYSFCG